MKCICVHAPEQHSEVGCEVTTMLGVFCTCTWDGKIPKLPEPTPEKKYAAETPTIGRTIHVRGRNSAGVAYGPCLPAIVTELLSTHSPEQQRIRCTVFGHTETLCGMTAVIDGTDSSAGYIPYCWHWPERA